ncbi:MAG: efflux RND transporter periplasmic adaptor subunit [Bacteroidaceae bacterium]|nr:efflux RND transporter periplasmic adaptor subunit [Bacteroidaceae bacterium]
MKKIITTAIATVAMIAAGCHKKAEESNAGAPLPVEVATPITREVTLTREYPGYLEADATISIVGRASGTLLKQNYTPGSRVKKGTTLFVIEPTLYENAVTQAQAELNTAEAELEYAQSNYERMQQAMESDAVSQIEVLQAKSNVKSYEAKVNNAKAALSTARTNLGYCYVKAPMDGVVGIENHSVGTYIPGAASPVELCKMYKDNKMYANFDIADNQWLVKQRRNNEVGKEEYITFTLGNDRYFSWKAKMDYLSPDINLSTGTLRVRAELDNSNLFLKPGSYISVVLPYEKIENGILVKDASIGTDQLGKFLYVVSDSNIVQYRSIETGNLVDDTLRLVTGGLKPGERYVTKALLKVRNGMPVTPVQEGTAGNR